MHPESIYGWQGFRLTVGDVSLGIVPDIGGRILSLTFKGEEFLYVHPPEQGKTYDLSKVGDILSFKKDFGFRLWGGDKTWVAPQHQWVYGIPPLDLDCGQYALESQGDSAVMTSPVCRETGLRIVRRVRLSSSGEISLTEELHNETDEPVTRGIWNVTQVMRPFDAWFPADLADVRSYHLEDQSLPHHEIPLKFSAGWVKIPCDSQALFKFGGIPREGKAVIVKPVPSGVIVVSREFDFRKKASYAHKSAFEVFNSNLFPYGEVE
ncbi:MAG: hypothetical protein HQL16_02885, partial [Candidatus Omnitrophica bacterium]|nr:hypothetical protein [Candidatus Omnitrophota bacterium]